jgi:hypothetical protein
MAFRIEIRELVVAAGLAAQAGAGIGGIAQAS